MIQSKRMAAALSISVPLFLVLLASLIFRNPVLLRLRGSIEQQHALYLLNPFRDRAPERAAEAILKEVSEGNCQAVAMRLSGKPDPKCVRDTELRILSWRLLARENRGSNDAMLLYEVKRDFAAGRTAVDPYWLNAQKADNGQWRVVTLDRWF